MNPDLSHNYVEAGFQKLPLTREVGCGTDPKQSDKLGFGKESYETENDVTGKNIYFPGH